jgi:hypothetical protein
MKSERKKILSIDIFQKDSKLNSKIKEIFEGFYELLYCILKDPLDNFWWECISLIIQYLQLSAFILDDKVSFNFYDNII